MKLITLLFVAVAGVVLGVVALRAPARDYVAPTAADVEAHAPAPESLSIAVPADCAVRTFDVQGMCCKGCTGKIYKHIKADPAVLDAAVSFDRGTVDVVVAKTADVAAIAHELTFDKYTAKAKL